MQRKAIYIQLALVLTASLITGCSKQNTYAVVADKGQTAGDYKITMTGSSGRIKTSARTNSQTGIDEALTEVVALHNANPTGNPWELKSENGMKLSFTVAAGKYYCDTCQENGLPMMWHREQ